MTVYVFVSLRLIRGSMLLWRALLPFILSSLNILNSWINSCAQTEWGCVLTFAWDYGTDSSLSITRVWTMAGCAISSATTFWNQLWVSGVGESVCLLSLICFPWLWKIVFGEQGPALSIIKAICWVVLFFFFNDKEEFLVEAYILHNSYTSHEQELTGHVRVTLGNCGDTSELQPNPMHYSLLRSKLHYSLWDLLSGKCR